MRKKLGVSEAQCHHFVFRVRHIAHLLLTPDPEPLEAPEKSLHPIDHDLVQDRHCAHSADPVRWRSPFHVPEDPRWSPDAAWRVRAPVVDVLTAKPKFEGAAL